MKRLPPRTASGEYSTTSPLPRRLRRFGRLVTRHTVGHAGPRRHPAYRAALAHRRGGQAGWWRPRAALDAGAPRRPL